MLFAPKEKGQSLLEVAIGIFLTVWVVLAIIKWGRCPNSSIWEILAIWRKSC